MVFGETRRAVVASRHFDEIFAVVVVVDTAEETSGVGVVDILDKFGHFAGGEIKRVQLRRKQVEASGLQRVLVEYLAVHAGHDFDVVVAERRRPCREHIVGVARYTGQAACILVAGHYLLRRVHPRHYALILAKRHGHTA